MPELVLQYELQKIITMGGSFMAAAGLFEPLKNPVLSSVQCGLKIIEKARQIPTLWTLST